MKTAVILLALFVAAIAAEESNTVVPPYKCEGNAFVCKFKELGHSIKHHAIHLGSNLKDVGSAILSSALDQGKNLLASGAQAVLGSVLDHLNKNVVGKREIILFNKLKDTAKAGFEALQKVKESLKNAFQKAVSRVTGFISNIAGLKVEKDTEDIDSVAADFKRESERSLLNFVDVVKQKLQDMFAAGISRVKEFFGIKNQEKRIILNALSNAWSVAKGAFSSAGQLLADTFRPHIDALNNGISSLVEKAKVHASGLVDTVADSFNNLKDKLNTHVDALKGHASKLGDHATNAVNALKEAVASIAAQTLQNAKDTVGDVVNTGKDAAKTVGDHVAGAISG